LLFVSVQLKEYLLLGVCAIVMLLWRTTCNSIKEI
jgi:hypothetical protein